LKPVDDLDRLIYGAENIGLVVNLSARQAYHALERGYLDGDKFGRKWRSTKRRLLKPPAGTTPITTAVPAPTPDRAEEQHATASLI
jgi:hypothetical protein